MFASPNRRNYKLSKSSSVGAIERSPTVLKIDYNRDKIVEKVIRNYMAKYNLLKVDPDLAKEIHHFFGKSNLSQNDFKLLDQNIKNIFSKKDELTYVNKAEQNYNQQMSPKSNSKDAFNESKRSGESVKLPIILSKSVTRIGSRTESRESRMSGASELSNKFSQNEESKRLIDQLIKDYSEKRDGSSASSPAFEEIIQSYEETRKQSQLRHKKDLEDQIQDRRLRLEEAIRKERELEPKNNGDRREEKDAEKERKDYLKQRQQEEKQALDKIVSGEKARKEAAIKEERLLERKAIRQLVDEIQEDKEKRKKKKNKVIEYYNIIKDEIEKKKQRDEQEIEKEKNFEQKCNSDIEKIFEKQDHARYLELTNKGINPNPKYEALNRNKVVSEQQSVRDSISERSLPELRKSIPDEEAMLRRIQEENLKKYEELEKKIKDLEAKLEIKNKREKNVQRPRIIRNSSSIIQPIAKSPPHVQRNKQDLNKGSDMAKSVTIKSSNEGGLGLPSKSTLVINNIKDSIIRLPKPVTSSLFTTQIAR